MESNSDHLIVEASRGDLKDVVDNDDLLIQYLLGELSEEQQEAIEQRYISDPEMYEQLLSVEDDLIDAYADGVLSASRRASFENHFLRSPERQARLGFAKAWIAYVSRQSKSARAVAPVPRRSFLDFLRFETWPVFLRATAAVLVLLAAAFLIAEILRLRNQIEQAESQRATLEKSQRELQRQIDEERRHSEELSSQLEHERVPQTNVPPQSPPGIISLILTPGLVRGAGDARRLIIPPEARRVRLRAIFGRGDYDTYEVVIKTVGGAAIWRKSGLKAQSGSSGKVLVIQAPAELFITEDYILTLNGLTAGGPAENIAEYSFSVSKK
jgi:cell division protein FtsL